MGRVSTYKKNCPSIDLLSAQVNDTNRAGHFTLDAPASRPVAYGYAPVIGYSSE